MNKAIIITLCIINLAWANNDLRNVSMLTYKSATTQWQDELTLWTIPIGVGATIWAYQKDNYFFKKNIHVSSFEKSVSDFVPIATLAIPLTFWSLSKYFKDEKMYKYSMEIAATMAVSMAEATLISFYPLHERPSSKDLNPAETLFRASSSFPSGHVMTYFAVALKTYQYYGWKAAITPLIATFITAQERVASKKHYLSDVVGGLFLTYWAHRGVSLSLSDESVGVGFKTTF